MARQVSTPPTFTAAYLATMLTRTQVAQALGLSGERVRQMTAEGVLTPLSTPLGNLYAPEQVERLRASRET